MSAPWIKFYPADWRADPALRMCSIAARGLWMEMLCVMHEADPCGYLMVNGKPLSDKQLAGLAGCSAKEAANLIQELDDAGVFSRDEGGTIYSRRILKDIAKAERDRENGKGGGNPRLKPGVNPPVKAHIPEARSQTLEGQHQNRNDIKNHSENSQPQPDTAPAFPSDGSIAYSEPWLSIAKTNGRGLDPDLLASAFRKLRRDRDQPLDGPKLVPAFTSFCRTHRIGTH